MNRLDHQKGVCKSAAQDASAPPPLPPHLRHASPRAWRRPAGDPGSAGARVGGHDGDLHAGESSATAAGDSGVGRASVGYVAFVPDRIRGRVVSFVRASRASPSSTPPQGDSTVLHEFGGSAPRMGVLTGPSRLADTAGTSTK